MSCHVTDRSIWVLQLSLEAHGNGCFEVKILQILELNWFPSAVGVVVYG